MIYCDRNHARSCIVSHTLLVIANVCMVAEFLAVHKSSDVVLQPAELQQQTAEDIKGVNCWWCGW